jgi:hypothetical protein
VAAVLPRHACSTKDIIVRRLKAITLVLRAFTTNASVTDITTTSTTTTLSSMSHKSSTTTTTTTQQHRHQHHIMYILSSNPRV